MFQKIRIQHGRYSLLTTGTRHLPKTVSNCCLGYRWHNYKLNKLKTTSGTVLQFTMYILYSTVTRFLSPHGLSLSLYVSTWLSFTTHYLLDLYADQLFQTLLPSLTISFSLYLDLFPFRGLDFQLPYHYYLTLPLILPGVTSLGLIILVLTSAILFLTTLCTQPLWWVSPLYLDLDLGDWANLTLLPFFSYYRTAWTSPR